MPALPAPTDVSGWTPPQIVFGSHSRSEEIGANLNNIFGSVLNSWNSLFADNSLAGDLSDVAAVADVCTALRTLIIDDIIVPLATTTQGTNAAAKRLLIQRLVDASPLFFGFEGGGKTRLTSRDQFNRVLATIHNASRANPLITSKMFVIINIQHIFFNPDLQQMDYLDWSEDHFKLTPFTNGPTTSAAPGVLTAIDIAAAVVKGVASSAGSIGYGKSILTNYAGPTSGYICPTSTLPADVKLRHDAWRNGEPLRGSLVGSEYTTADYYYEDPSATVPGAGSERYFLADGTLFIVRNVSYTTLLKLPATKCTDVSRAGIRVWYYTVCKTLMDHGVYVHPFWCFRRGVGGYWGFDIAQNPCAGEHADVPHNMRNPLLVMSSAVHSHISKSGTFDSKSEFTKIIKNCPSDGYRALKLIILRSHPNFVENPAQYLGEFPRQRHSESVFDFGLAFDDFLKVKAFVMDECHTMGDKQVQDIFLARMLYSSWIKQRTYEERKLQPHLYTNDLF